MRRGIYKGPLVLQLGGDRRRHGRAEHLQPGELPACHSRWRDADRREQHAEHAAGRRDAGIAMGLHVRCGIEDNLWNQTRTGKMTTVQQIEQLVRTRASSSRGVARARKRASSCGIRRVLRHHREETLPQPRLGPMQRWRPPGATSARGLRP